VARPLGLDFTETEIARIEALIALLNELSRVRAASS
jgi:hypothetical protein